MNHLLQKLLIGSSAFAMAAAIPASAAFAQAANTDDTENIEQVVVSASRVTIAGYSQPTPVTVVGTAQLQQDAFTNVEDSLRSLPQVTANPSYLSTAADIASTGEGGTNFVNLRNLGIARTLVLFDSQRVVNATIGSSGQTNVDITLLPQGVISRVDIVTGGASAAWGSDAVAGVVNFVINKNITGFKADVQDGYAPGGGGYRDYSVNTSWGEDIFGGRGHIEFAGTADIRPNFVELANENYFSGAAWVSNPAYAPSNGQPQLIEALNVGTANATQGGIINASPKGTGATPAAANTLRGIEFVNSGVPVQANYGNLSLGVSSNGGSFSDLDSSAPFNAITQPLNSYTFFGYGRYKLTDTIQASFQANVGYVTNKGENTSTTQTALVIQSDNAFIPAAVRATMQTGGITSFTLGTYNTNNFDIYSSTGANFSSNEGNMAPSIYTNRRDVWRGVFSLDGTIGENWSWTAYIQHSASRVSLHDLSTPIAANQLAAEDAVTVTSANVGTSGALIGSIACRSTLTGTAVVANNVTAQRGCVPLDVFGNDVASQAALAYIDGASQPLAATTVNGFSYGPQSNSLNYDHQSLQQDVIEGTMQGTLPWGLPAGRAAIAFGAGYRKEAGWGISNAIAAVGGYVAGDGGIVPPSQYNVLEGFAEIDAPILKDNIVNSLDFSMAGRMTSYSTSGLVETWKLGATSQVNNDIKLRTTWSVDIRAPDLAELFTAVGAAGTQTYTDPKTNTPVNIPNPSTGNPHLIPEVALTISGGAVLTPDFIPGLSLSADWYSINLKEEIGSVSPTIIVNQCNPSLASVIHPGQDGNPNDPLCAALQFNGPNGALSEIVSNPVNLASQTTSGMDLQANYTMDFWEGTLDWQAVANLNDEFTLTNPGIGKTDSAGSAGAPKWRGILEATYRAGPYTATVQGRWFGTSVDATNGNTGNQASAANALLYDPAHFEVPFTAYLDLRGSYKWNDNIEFYGAIDNTTNVPPALVLAPNTSLYFGLNTNIAVYDQLGRAFRFGVRFNY